MGVCGWEWEWVISAADDSCYCTSALPGGHLLLLTYTEPKNNLFLFYHILLHGKWIYLIDNLMYNFFKLIWRDLLRSWTNGWNTHTHVHIIHTIIKLHNTCRTRQARNWRLKYTYRKCLAKAIDIKYVPLHLSWSFSISELDGAKLILGVRFS